MTGSPKFSTPNIVVPANGTRLVNAVGNFLENMTQTTALGSLTITIDGGNACRFEAGDTYILPGTDTFSQFLLTNTTGAPITVQVGIALGEIKSASAVIVDGTVATTLSSGTTLVDTPDVAVAAGTAVKVATGTGTDKTKIISNLLANDTVVRVGTSAAGAARGAEIPIGTSANIDTTADVWVYNPSGNGINIGILITRA